MVTVCFVGGALGWNGGKLQAAQTCGRHAVRRARACQVVRMAAESPKGDDEEKEVPFEIRGFSLANFGTFLGILVTGYSFFEYFTSSGVATASSLGFIYGIPILLIGLALKYAELKPVPVRSTEEGLALRETKATPILKKVIQDVTRHRYGDEQHLDGALKSIGLIPRGAACPELLELKETSADGEYALTLKFFSKETPYSLWEEKVARCERFFGPGITAAVEKANAEKRIVALTLTTVPEGTTTPVAEEKVAPAAEEEVAPAAEEKVAPAAEEKVAPAAEEKVAPAAEEKVAPAAEEKVAKAPEA